ncbi:hypothetical protein M758_3G057200 [Ceratodon purpureus]|nr:hypothetical protein M758_3G057200 [Ceratodon purpureus]
MYVLFGSMSFLYYVLTWSGLYGEHPDSFACENVETNIESIETSFVSHQLKI